MAVTQLTLTESMLIADEIGQYHKYEAGTHGASGGFVGQMFLDHSAKGTVTIVGAVKSDSSAYLYRFYIDPLPGDEKASEGGFLIDLATGIEHDVRPGTCVEVFFRAEESGHKKAVAVFPCH